MMATTAPQQLTGSADYLVDQRVNVIERVDSRSKYRIAIAAVVVFYLILAIGRTVADSPGCDEGWFASPAINLATNGRMATTIIEESNLKMTTGIHQYTYWIMPLNVVTQAAVYRVLGFGLFSMRSISIVFGIVALAAWLSIMQSLSGDRKVALLAFALIAIDFAFVRSSSTGRMDMMSAALNFSAFAAYLRLRNRNFTLAVLVSQGLIVASGLTHPNGFLGFLGLIFLTLYYDRPRIKWKHIALSAVPYVIALLAYGYYVAHDPNLFLTQLSGNGGGRLWGVANPWGALKYEIAERYLGLSAGGVSYLKGLLLLIYLTGIAGALFTREIRQNKGYKALLIIAALCFAYLTLFEGTKLYLYMIHVTPIYMALLAAWIGYCWRNLTVPRWLLAPAVCCLVLLQLAGSGYVVLRNKYRSDYLPAVGFLNQHADRNSFIMGTAEIGFALRYRDTLLDDKWLGYNTGRTPDFIVEDARYQQDQLSIRDSRPEIYEHIVRLLADQYRPVYDHGSYRIYARQ